MPPALIVKVSLTEFPLVSIPSIITSPDGAPTLLVVIELFLGTSGLVIPATISCSAPVPAIAA